MSFQMRPCRRWFQFSLRWLMVLTLVAASFFAGLTYQRKVNQRLRDEVERAKLTLELAQQEAELARMLANLKQQETAYAKREAARAIRELHRELLSAMQKDTPTERNAALSRLEKLMELKQESLTGGNGNLQAPSFRRAYQAPPAFLPQSARDFWQSFQPGGNPPPDGDKTPIKKSKANPELQFDQPLIDRTIG